MAKIEFKGVRHAYPPPPGQTPEYALKEVSQVWDDGGAYATFENGSLLGVDYYAAGNGGGTWTVLEVEGTNITDNGLAFAPGVDTGPSNTEGSVTVEDTELISNHWKRYLRIKLMN